MDVLAKNTKREDGLKDPHFVFLMFLLFSMFSSFASYGIWGVFIHGMPPPILDASGGVLFLGFILFVDGRKEGVW
jgi:hypothetical protein